MFYVIVACLAITELVAAMGDNLMKFMKTEMTDWPIQADTDKKNVTLWEEGDAYISFQYYIRRL